MTVDIWIGDYNPPRCFQKKISGRGKHNGTIHGPDQVCGEILGCNEDFSESSHFSWVMCMLRIIVLTL
jgi:hypothetical protein